MNVIGRNRENILYISASNYYPAVSFHQVDSLSAAIRQLEMERDQLTRSVREEQEKHRRLLSEMEVKQQQDGKIYKVVELFVAV